MAGGGRKSPAPEPPASGEDDAFFAREMQDVRPLDRKTGRVHIAGGAPPPRRTPTSIPQAGDGLAVVERWGERFALLAAGVDRRVLRELGSKERPPEAELDLHGLTVERAIAALAAFVARGRGEGRRVLLVIHGRGRHSGAQGPVLREALVDALLAAPLSTSVLAAVSAPPALGGAGAAVLLLRRPG